MREETIRVVSVLDPAIDTEAMTATEMSEYARTRDIKLLKFKPNVAPTIFHVKEINHRLMEEWVLEDTSNEAQVQRRCFQSGVFKVQNLYARDGVFMSEWVPKSKDGGKSEIIADESLERFSTAERIEIGQVAWDHSFLHPRIEPSYRLPPLSVTSLVRREFRHADASQSSQGSINSEASSEQGSPQPLPAQTESDKPASEKASDSPMAATAVATT